MVNLTDPSDQTKVCPWNIWLLKLSPAKPLAFISSHQVAEFVQYLEKQYPKCYENILLDVNKRVRVNQLGVMSLNSSNFNRSDLIDDKYLNVNHSQNNYLPNNNPNNYAPNNHPPNSFPNNHSPKNHNFPNNHHHPPFINVDAVATVMPGQRIRVSILDFYFYQPSSDFKSKKSMIDIVKLQKAYNDKRNSNSTPQPSMQTSFLNTNYQSKILKRLKRKLKSNVKTDKLIRSNDLNKRSFIRTEKNENDHKGNFTNKWSTYENYKNKIPNINTNNQITQFITNTTKNQKINNPNKKFYNNTNNNLQAADTLFYDNDTTSVRKSRRFIPSTHNNTQPIHTNNTYNHNTNPFHTNNHSNTNPNTPFFHTNYPHNNNDHNNYINKDFEDYNNKNKNYKDGNDYDQNKNYKINNYNDNYFNNNNNNNKNDNNENKYSYYYYDNNHVYYNDDGGVSRDYSNDDGDDKNLNNASNYTHRNLNKNQYSDNKIDYSNNKMNNNKMNNDKMNNNKMNNDQINIKEQTIDYSACRFFGKIREVSWREKVNGDGNNNKNNNNYNNANSRYNRKQQYKYNNKYQNNNNNKNKNNIKNSNKRGRLNRSKVLNEDIDKFEKEQYNRRMKRRQDGKINKEKYSGANADRRVVSEEVRVERMGNGENVVVREVEIVVCGKREHHLLTSKEGNTVKVEIKYHDQCYITPF